MFPEEKHWPFVRLCVCVCVYVFVCVGRTRGCVSIYIWCVRVIAQVGWRGGGRGGRVCPVLWFGPCKKEQFPVRLSSFMTGENDLEGR